MMYAKNYSTSPVLCKPRVAYRAGNASAPASIRPMMNASEHADGLLLEFALPGVQRSDIRLELKDEVLWLEAKRPGADDAARYHRREMSHLPFRRGIRLGERYDAASCQASLVHGVLQVRVPHRNGYRKEVDVK
jgi:HSP20 family molecular chaperone IbpA